MKAASVRQQRHGPTRRPTATLRRQRHSHSPRRHATSPLGAATTGPDTGRRAAVTAVAAVTLVLLLVACSATADLEVTDVRSRMSPMLTGVGAVYLDITNGTDVDEQLLAGSVDSSVAGAVEVHETFDADEAAHDDGMAEDDEAHDAGMAEDGAQDGAQDGAEDGAQDGAHHDDMDHDRTEPTPEGFAMMGMREIDALTIPAGTTVELVPGGYHLMLLELADDLVPGDTFDLTLTFAEAGEVTVTVEVREDI